MKTSSNFLGATFSIFKRNILKDSFIMLSKNLNQCLLDHWPLAQINSISILEIDIRPL